MNQRANKVLFVLGILFILIISTNPVFSGRIHHLFIIGTSDEHGHLFDYDFISKKEFPGGLVRVSSMVNEFKEKTGGGPVLILSAGDIIQGTVLTSLHNSRFKEEKDPMIIAMNHIGYEASALGNHDIEQGLEVLEELQKQADFPILAANAIYEGSDNKPYFKPYTIIQKGELKIAILGMITPGIPNWLNKEVYSGIEFLSIPESAKYWATKIRKEEEPDLLIGLLHSGFGKKEKGEEHQEGPIENAARETAEAVPELDIIISGHIHIPVEQETVNGVLVTQPGAYAERVTLISLVFEEKSGNWEIVSKNTELISLEDYAPDPVLEKKLDSYFQATKKYSETPLCKIERKLDTHHGYFKDTAILDLVHRVQLHYSGADISLAALFNPKLELESGDITIADIAGIYKYENFLYVRKMTGNMIKDYLEYSATFFNHIDLFDEEGVISGKLKGYNYDTIQGLNYKIDLSKPEGERIISLTDPRTGEPINPEKEYLVAMNNYRSNGGGGHLEASGSLDTEIVYRSAKPIRDLIIEYLQSGREFKTEPDNNWKIIQEETVLEIINKDINSIKGMR